MEDVKRYVARLRAARGGDELTIGARRAGRARAGAAVDRGARGRGGAEPGRGRRAARAADGPREPARGVRGDQGGEGPRLGVVPLDRALHDGRAGAAGGGRSSTTSATREEGAPSGRCCDVCDPDLLLERALAAPVAAAARRAARGGRRASGRIGDRGSAGTRRRCGGRGALRAAGAWRWARAEGKPAYTVAANAVLEEILRRRPASVASADRDPRDRPGVLREARRVAAGGAGGAVSVNWPELRRRPRNLGSDRSAQRDRRR